MGAFQKFLFHVKIQRVNAMKESTEKMYQKIGENVYRFRVLHKGITCTAMINIAEALNVPTCVLLAQEACPKYLECLQQMVIYPDRS